MDWLECLIIIFGIITLVQGSIKDNDLLIIKGVVFMIFGCIM